MNNFESIVIEYIKTAGSSDKRILESFGSFYIKEAGLSDRRILESIGYFEAPASKGHHLAVNGGLYMHSINVTHHLLRLTEAMEIDWSREESPYIVGMLHDLVKTRCYKQTVEGPTKDGPVGYRYIQPAYPGHGIASALIAAELGIQLNEDERAAIVYHMGLYGVGKEYTNEEIGKALEVFSGQIIATHSADLMAACIEELGGASTK